MVIKSEKVKGQQMALSERVLQPKQESICGSGQFHWRTWSTIALLLLGFTIPFLFIFLFFFRNKNSRGSGKGWRRRVEDRVTTERFRWKIERHRFIDAVHSLTLVAHMSARTNIREVHIF